jgi:hypothetical protein
MEVPKKNSKKGEKKNSSPFKYVTRNFGAAARRALDASPLV